MRTLAAMADVTVEEVTRVTPEIEEAFARLVPQLSKSASLPSRDELAEMATSEATTLLVARDPDDGGRVVGAMALVLFRIPTGLRGWIEDVVVEDRVRGRGVGAAMNRRALEIAAVRGARTVDLTSRPSREAANRLYARLGFVRRDTNVYRYEPGTAG